MRLIIFILLLVVIPVQAQIREPIRLGRGSGTSLAWHPSGDVLAVGSTTGVWILDTELNVISNFANIGSMSDLDWNDDGHQLAVLNRQSVTLWQISADFKSAERSELMLPPFEQEATASCVLWIGDLIGAAEYRWEEFYRFEKLTAVYDASTGETLSTIPADFESRFTNHCDESATSPDGKKELTYYPAQSSTRAKDMLVVSEIGSQDATITPFGGFISTIDWSPDSYTFAVLATDGEMGIWQADQPYSSQIANELFFTQAGNSVQWSSDGRYLLTSNQADDFISSDANIYIWDQFDSDQQHPAITIHQEDDDNPSARWIPDTHLIVYFSSSHWSSSEANIYDIDSGKRRGIYKTADNGQYDYIEWNRLFTSYAYWDGDKINIFHLEEAVDFLDWDAEANVFRTRGNEIPPAHEIEIILLQPINDTVYWSPDSSKIAANVEDQYTLIWDAQSGELLLTLDKVEFRDWKNDTEFYGFDENGRAVWDAITGQRLNTVGYGLLSPDETKLAVIDYQRSGNDTLQILDAETSQSILEVTSDKIVAVHWQPDSREIVVINEIGLTVWDTETGEHGETIEVPSPISASWSDTRLAIASWDGTIYVWNINALD